MVERFGGIDVWKVEGWVEYSIMKGEGMKKEWVNWDGIEWWMVERGD